MNILEIPWTIHMKGRWKGQMVLQGGDGGPLSELAHVTLYQEMVAACCQRQPKKAEKNEADFSPLASLVSHQPVSSTFFTVQQCLQDKRGPKKYTELQIMQWLFTWIPFLNCSR